MRYPEDQSRCGHPIVEEGFIARDGAEFLATQTPLGMTGCGVGAVLNQEVEMVRRANTAPLRITTRAFG